MTHPTITIQFQPTEDEAELWKGRMACIAPMTPQEWTDLWTFFRLIDGFVEQIAQPLAVLHEAVATGKTVPLGTFRKLVALSEDAKGAATLMPAIQSLMSRFAVVADPVTKKGRVQ